MKLVLLFLLSVGSTSLLADAGGLVPKLRLSSQKCKSPCKVTLDASKSKAAKGKTIKKYIFDFGDGQKLESDTGIIEHTFINFKTTIAKQDQKHKNFSVKLKLIQSDDRESHEDSKNLLVSLSDQLPTIDGGDLVPPMPDPGVNNSTLLGVDIDEDGVRDDVELWINSFARNSQQLRKVLKKMSLDMKNELIATQTSKEMSIEASNQYLKTIDCLFSASSSALEAQKNSALLESKYYNTKERMELENLSSNYFNGQSGPDINVSNQEYCNNL